MAVHDGLYQASTVHAYPEFPQSLWVGCIPRVDAGCDLWQLLLDRTNELCAQFVRQEVSADIGASAVGRIGLEECHLVLPGCLHSINRSLRSQALKFTTAAKTRQLTRKSAAGRFSYKWDLQ